MKFGEMAAREHLQVGRLLNGIDSKNLSISPKDQSLWKKVIDAWNKVEIERQKRPKIFDESEFSNRGLR